MPHRYIRPSELGSFVFCRRAWFLERQGEASALTQTGGIEPGARGAPVHSTRRTPRAGRLSALLLILGVAGFTCAALLTLVRP